jgi:hypothetical protein
VLFVRLNGYFPLFCGDSIQLTCVLQPFALLNLPDDGGSGDGFEEDVTSTKVYKLCLYFIIFYNLTFAGSPAGELL